MLASSPPTRFDNNPIFARHESFHPRYGWLKKGFDHHHLLNDPDAAVHLGVGKNMVTAMRYWAMAFKVIDDHKTNRGSASELAGSYFGERVFGPNGWDPFMEHPATLWLLHWYLLKRPCHATAWYFAFYLYHRSEFSVDDLVEALFTFKQVRYPQAKASENSLRKDATCLLRMYARQAAGGRDVLEDSLDSPFVELGLIVPSAKPRHFSFNIGPKTTLPAEFAVATCLEYIASEPELNQAQTVSLGRLLNDEGSPGQAFKLSEAAMCDAFETIERCYAGLVRLTETAGVVQVSLKCAADTTANSLLDTFYRRELTQP
jgi:Protein of unknown function (DUF4007)